MKAVIKSVEAVTLPLFNAEKNEDVLTPQVKIEVEYDNDDDSVHSTQEYSYLPENLPDTAEEIQAIFDAQALAMQNDIDTASTNAEAQAKADAVTKKVELVQGLIKPTE